MYFFTVIAVVVFISTFHIRIHWFLILSNIRSINTISVMIIILLRYLWRLLLGFVNIIFLGLFFLSFNKFFLFFLFLFSLLDNCPHLCSFQLFLCIFRQLLISICCNNTICIILFFIWFFYFKFIIFKDFRFSLSSISTMNIPIFITFYNLPFKLWFSFNFQQLIWYLFILT